MLAEQLSTLDIYVVRLHLFVKDCVIEGYEIDLLSGRKKCSMTSM